MTAPKPVLVTLELRDDTAVPDAQGRYLDGVARYVVVPRNRRLFTEAGDALGTVLRMPDDEAARFRARRHLRAEELFAASSVAARTVDEQTFFTVDALVEYAAVSGSPEATARLKLVCSVVAQEVRPEYDYVDRRGQIRTLPGVGLVIGYKYPAAFEAPEERQLLARYGVELTAEIDTRGR